MIWKLLACIFMTVTAAFIVTVIMDIRKKKKTSLTFKDSIHNTGLPIISLKLQIPDKTFIIYNFIVDTGSTVNVINTSYVKDLYSEDIKFVFDSHIYLLNFYLMINHIKIIIRLFKCK